jgi:hypothetical protein
VAVHTKSQRQTLAFGHFVCKELLCQQLERDSVLIEKASVRRWLLDILFSNNGFVSWSNVIGC